MSLKTRADIALEKQKLRHAERQVIANENLALGSEIAKGIKAGYFDGEAIYKTLALKTKSKKHRALARIGCYCARRRDPQTTLITGYRIQ